MESKLNNEINNLKKMIESVFQHTRLHDFSQSIVNDQHTTKSPIETSQFPNTMKSELSYPGVANTNQIPEKRFLDGNKILSSTSSNEKSKTASLNPKHEYTYYWKLDNFPKGFQNARKQFSHVFNVKGLFLRIRAVLSVFESENLLLSIEHLANVENSEKMEIEITDGSLVFKEIAEEKLFQYSFTIIDQTKPNHDLVSPFYWNTEGDGKYVIPNSINLLSNYMKENSLLIKLFIMF